MTNTTTVVQNAEVVSVNKTQVHMSCSVQLLDQKQPLKPTYHLEECCMYHRHVWLQVNLLHEWLARTHLATLVESLCQNLQIIQTKTDMETPDMKRKHIYDNWVSLLLTVLWRWRLWIIIFQLERKLMQLYYNWCQAQQSPPCAPLPKDSWLSKAVGPAMWRCQPHSSSEWDKPSQYIKHPGNSTQVSESRWPA